MGTIDVKCMAIAYLKTEIDYHENLKWRSEITRWYLIIDEKVKDPITKNQECFLRTAPMLTMFSVTGFHLLCHEY